MNAARLDTSDRLRRVDHLLSDGRWHTTREIIRRAHVCAVNSICAELRDNGRRIECQRRGLVWRYRRCE